MMNKLLKPKGVINNNVSVELFDELIPDMIKILRRSETWTKDINALAYVQ